METTKLASFTLCNEDGESFGVTITENILDPERISYIVLFTNMSADSAWCDSFFHTFTSAEDADRFVQDFIDAHGSSVTDIEKDIVLASDTYVSDTGVKYEAELHRVVDVWRSGFLAVGYEVKASWGEMEDGEICISNHGYDVFEFQTLGDARRSFEYYVEG